MHMYIVLNAYTIVGSYLLIPTYLTRSSPGPLIGDRSIHNLTLSDLFLHYHHHHHLRTWYDREHFETPLTTPHSEIRWGGPFEDQNTLSRVSGSNGYIVINIHIESTLDVFLSFI